MSTVWNVGSVCRAELHGATNKQDETKQLVTEIKREMAKAKELSPFKEAQIVQLSASTSIAEIAEKFEVSQPRVRDILRKNGVKLTRGRKRGSGIGLRVAGGKKPDRRLSWQTRQIENGLCTSCGEPNDSESIYHCKKCLKKRTDAKKKK